MDDGLTGTRGHPANIRLWTLDLPRKVITGLWHLEGETVSILGDGNVFPQQVVVNGTVTLSVGVTRCHVGLPFTARARTLPLVVPNANVEGRRKKINGIALRLQNTRGLTNGRDLNSLYPMKERTTEQPGLPTRMINGIKHQLISSNWNEDGQTYFVQTDPLPVTILSTIVEVEIGDDPD